MTQVPGLQALGKRLLRLRDAPARIPHEMRQGTLTIVTHGGGLRRQPNSGGTQNLPVLEWLACLPAGRRVRLHFGRCRISVVAGELALERRMNRPRSLVSLFFRQAMEIAASGASVRRV